MNLSILKQEKIAYTIYIYIYTDLSFFKDKSHDILLEKTSNKNNTYINISYCMYASYAFLCFFVFNIIFESNLSCFKDGILYIYMV